jgi:hypothetical protein
MTKTPEQARAEIQGVIAYRILGPCTCSVEYSSRKLIDPACRWHDFHEEVEEALEEEYQKGRAEATEAAAKVAAAYDFDEDPRRIAEAIRARRSKP